VHIKNRIVVDSTWAISDSDTQPLGSVSIFIPYADWLALDENTRESRRDTLGAWLSVDQEPGNLSTYPDHLAIQFLSFTDGRGYSLARILREENNYSGDLYAVGDVLRDQLRELERCGFNAFVLRADQDVRASISAFDDFDYEYQRSVVSKSHGANSAVK
jgi:uncharacterized protein (DUF934 family)